MNSLDRLAGTSAAPVAGPAASSDAAPLRGVRYGEDRLHLLVRDPRRVLALWELSPATAGAAAETAAIARTPLRVVLRVERERGDAPPDVVASADLPDAFRDESWYVDIPPRAGRCRARIGLDLPAGFHALLTSRWAATPPDGPCETVESWALSPEGRAWAAREAERGNRDLPSLSGSSARFLPPGESEA